MSFLLIHNVLGKADVGACRQWSIDQPNYTGVEHKEPCARRGGGRRRIRFLKGKERDLVTQMSKSHELALFKEFLPWVPWPALKGSKNFRRMCTCKNGSINNSSFRMLEQKSVTQKQRCNVEHWAIWVVLCLFWSDAVIVSKTENFLRNSIEKVWHLQKGQSVNTAFPINNASFKKTN